MTVLRKKVMLATFVLVTAAISLLQAGDRAQTLLAGVQHLKQSTVIISREQKTIYLDPFLLTTSKHDADFVLVTHQHADHFSPAHIKAALKPGGILVVPEDTAAKAKSLGFGNVLAVGPEQAYEAGGLKFETVRAYNLASGYHPKAANWVGYILHLDGVTFYFAGDTDLIPEMESIKADVVFLPVGGTYTMTAAEAAKAANLIKPAVAVPIHFGDVVGSVKDAEKFVSLLDPAIEGVILKAK